MPKRPDSVPTFLGIDPGVNGGIAVVSWLGAAVWPMHVTERDIWGLIKVLRDTGIAFAMIEKVGGFMGGGGKNMAAAHTMFKFGASVGFLRGCLTSAGIPFDEITPQRWQKAIGVNKRSKAESKTQFKNRLKQKAQQLFPYIPVTLKTCDALLIAEYCKRLKEFPQ